MFTNASGLRVLSDAYSNPISTILTSFILPIDVDIATMFAFCPFTLIELSSILEQNLQETFDRK